MENKEFMNIIEGLKENINDKIEKFLEDSEELKMFIEFRKKHFYNYSIRNMVLIYQQNRSASIVAGFKKWKELGYNIKKGAKAIKILVPLITNREKEGKNEKYVYGYKYANVFDIKSTVPTDKAVELPTIDTRMKRGNSQYRITELFKRSKEIVEQYIPVEVTNELEAKGMTDGKKIYIKKDRYAAMSGTLMHEFTHYLNHFDEENIKNPNQEEVEAEVGAMLYGSYFNLDISGKYKYIALWKSEKVRLDEAFDVALSSFEQFLYGFNDKKGLIDLMEAK